LQQLNFQPLWGDEGWSFYFAAQTLPQLVALTAVDIHPPLYDILLKTWLILTDFGPEAARFFSVSVGALLIPAVGVLGWRLLDKRGGIAAAGVTALAPIAIYYSQEVRMYGLVTLLCALASYAFIRLPDPRPQTPNPFTFWPMVYVITITAALYTMYYAAFIFLAQILYSLIEITLIVCRQQSAFISAVRRLPSAVILAVGLLYLPWLLYAGPQLVNYVQNKRTVEGYLPLNLARFIGDHLAAFSLGHLPEVLQPYLGVALIFVGLAVVGSVVVWLAQRPSSLYLYLYLLAPLGLGYAVNLIFPFSPLYFERTLLLAAPAFWLFIAAGLAWLWQRQPLLIGIGVLALVLITAVSLVGFYTLPRYPNEDYRPLLRDIAARATPADTLLASYQWQLGFYHAYLPNPQPQFYAVPGWGEGWAGVSKTTPRQQDLANILANSPRLWFPAHQALGHFWEDEAEADIAALGYPALLVWHSPQTKLNLAGAGQPPQLKASAANFANRLMLLEASLGSGSFEAGRGIIPIDLTWRKQASLGSDHRVSLRLADTDGRTWAIRDSLPRAGQVSFTDLAVGDTLADRHGLLIPAGTPPGHYQLLLSVRRVEDDHPLDLLDNAGQPVGAEHLLGQVEVIDPDPLVGPAALPVQISINADFGQSARLVGYSLGSGPFKAGEVLPLNLFWQSLTQSPGPLLATQIQLQDSAGQTVLAYERPPLRPTDQWQSGTLLRDPYEILLPPTLPPGEYQLVVALADPTQARLAVNGSDQLRLTRITTIDRPHMFGPPSPPTPLAVDFSDQIKLVGLDLSQTTFKPGQALPLTLYWQALRTPDRNWSVFVHLINPEGHIVSQQDQAPGAGQFPTTGWLPGEYLTDPYNLSLPSDLLPGQYWLEVGLYDPNNFSRLPIVESGQIIADHLVLTDWPIMIE
jgi:hypothetical protein